MKKVSKTRPAYAVYEKEHEIQTMEKNSQFILISLLITYYGITNTPNSTNNEKQNDIEHNKWTNDTRTKILFKEFNENFNKQKEAFLKMWEILKSQVKLIAGITR